jgi:DNA-binding NarL/FixJ family response regulator
MVCTVVLADDMDLALVGIQTTLVQQAESVDILGVYRSLSKLAEGLADLRPDVILLGDRLEPDLDVLALVERVQQLAPRARLLVMSYVPNGLVVNDLLACGVAGYLYKNDLLSYYLEDAIRAVMRGRPYLSPTANAEYLLAMQSGRADWRLDAEAREVLRLLAQGYRSQEIALMNHVPVRRIYWVTEKLRDRFGAETNEHLIARAAEEGFLP